MATFTKLADDKPASISLNPSHKISKINDNIYGGFVEHMGRCIYGGVYDPGNPLSDENGFRKDVIDAIKELQPPVMRYPGGNFTATYHWTDGVGPKDQRPARPELAWIGRETNQFGTDEFMKWCEIVGTEPYLCFNMGTGTLDEALAWLEYCNSDNNTYYANMRRKNGRDKPYKVKYWALGNEVWGSWQVAQKTKEEYARQAFQWSKALKLLDPSIELVLCGENGYSVWDEHVLKECITSHNTQALGGDIDFPLIQMHSIHWYTYDIRSHAGNVTAPRCAERAIEICAGLLDYARIYNNVPNSVPHATICFDEWNVWDADNIPGEKGAEQEYNLSDALGVAVWLNAFVRQSKYVGMANIAQSANVLSPVLTHKDGHIKQTIFPVVKLFSHYMRGWTVQTHVACAEYEGPTKPEWIRGTIETPWLDVSAAVDDQGMLNLVVVNVSEEKDFETGIAGDSGIDGAGEVEVLRVNAENIGVKNTKEAEPVKIEKSSVKPEGKKVVFPKHSLTLLRWKANA